MTRKSRTVEEDHPWSTYDGTPHIHVRLRDFLDMLWCLTPTEEVRFFGCANSARASDAPTTTAHLRYAKVRQPNCPRRSTLVPTATEG